MFGLFLIGLGVIGLVFILPLFFISDASYTPMETVGTDPGVSWTATWEPWMAWTNEDADAMGKIDIHEIYRNVECGKTVWQQLAEMEQEDQREELS